MSYVPVEQAPRQARVIALGYGGERRVTCEVIDEGGTQHTIWWSGQKVGETVTIEQRVGAGGPYWALAGGSR